MSHYYSAQNQGPDNKKSFDLRGESMLNDCLPLVKILYVKAHPEARKDMFREAPEHLQERKKEGGDQ